MWEAIWQMMWCGKGSLPSLLRSYDRCILSTVIWWDGGDAVLLQAAAWMFVYEPCLSVGVLWAFGEHWKYGFACSRITFSNQEEGVALLTHEVSEAQSGPGQISRPVPEGWDVTDLYHIQIRNKALALWFTSL